jgi:hypothetical protein
MTVIVTGGLTRLAESLDLDPDLRAVLSASIHYLDELAEVIDAQRFGAGATSLIATIEHEITRVAQLLPLGRLEAANALAEAMRNIEQGILVAQGDLDSVTRASLMGRASHLHDDAVIVRADVARRLGAQGGRDLSRHFARFSIRELIQAEVFRFLSILLIGGAIFLAWQSAYDGTPPDLTTFKKLALLIAIGALAAYFARQAGGHRRAANWARTLKVQLESFGLLIEPLPDEIKHDIYRDFARRVLGAPPEGKEKSESVPLPTAQLIDLLAATVKRTAM